MDKIEHVTNDFLKHVYVVNPSAGGGGGGGGTLIGTNAALPAPSVDGRLYFTTDSPLLYRDTGSIWNSFGPLYPLTDPNLQTWTAMNTGGSTVTPSNGHRVLDMPTQSANVGEYIGGLTSNYSVELGFMVSGGRGGGRGGGYSLGAFFTDGTKLETFYSDFNGGAGWAIYDWTDATTFSTTVLAKTFVSWSNPWFLKLTDDGVNRHFYQSSNGTDWVLMFSRGRTVFLTATGAGYSAFPATDNSVHLILDLIHCKVTT